MGAARWCLAAALLVACTGTDASPATTEPGASIAPTTTPVPTASSAPPEPPADALVAVPQQGRDDVAADRFQVRVINGTDEQLRVVGVQFVWAGFTTEVVSRGDTVVSGQRIDFPVLLPRADCAGDGSAADMPSLDGARVRLTLDGGDVREVPVYDTDGVAAALYLRDCERQMMQEAVQLEWVDLEEAPLDGRPVTRGQLRATRGAADGTITVVAVGDTIPFRAVFATPPGEPVLMLPAGATSVDVDVTFVEARCDAHALAEAKQPFNFILQVDLGDGVVHPFLLQPPVAAREPMRLTAADACVALGLAEPLG